MNHETTAFWAQAKNRGQRLRLRHRETDEWLHSSGTGTTPREAYAWTGTRAQARALRAAARTAGRPWPFAAEPVPDKPDPLLFRQRGFA